MLIVDSHEDLAWNILALGRDYTRPAAETREVEHNTENPTHNGDTLLGWADYQRGKIAVVFGTLFASPRRLVKGEWDSQVYADISQAHLLYSTQLDTYHRLCDEHPNQFRLIQIKADLKAVLDAWQSPTDNLCPTDDLCPTDALSPRAPAPVGIVPLMEGAEGVRDPGELEEWWQRGVRMIGPAWAGNRFCGGTREPGPLTPEGFALLEAMADFGFGLDLSHMDAKAALQALDVFPSTIVATHANAAALLKDADTNRHLPDTVIRGLIERDGVIGIVPFNKFLLVGWKPADGRHWVTLKLVAAQIDYICQMAGDAYHVGIGTDFDGGFGVQSAPAEVDTIADLPMLVPLLAEKGYTEADITAIFGGNWLDRINRILPEVE